MISHLIAAMGRRMRRPSWPGHWYDPFNRNKLKGDYPIIGQQTFLSVSATSDTFVTRRRIPIPSGLGSVDPDSQEFFGKFGQTAVSQTFAFTFDLFHGDTSFADRLAHSRDAVVNVTMCKSARTAS